MLERKVVFISVVRKKEDGFKCKTKLGIIPGGLALVSSWVIGHFRRRFFCFLFIRADPITMTLREKNKKKSVQVTARCRTNQYKSPPPLQPIDHPAFF